MRENHRKQFTVELENLTAKNSPEQKCTARVIHRKTAHHKAIHRGHITAEKLKKGFNVSHFEVSQLTGKK
jgi:hypothetical protein